MTKTRLACLISAILLWGSLVSATIPPTHHTIFFTAPTERKVFKIEVDVDELARAVVPYSLQITQLLPTLPYGYTPKDIAFGPDGNLYIIFAADKICRMPESGGSCITFYEPGGATGLGGMRFLGNDLYFTAAQGIFRKNISESTPTAAVQVTTQALTARGMTVSLTGDLIPLNGTSMFRVQRASTTAFNTTGQVLNLNGFFSATSGVAAEPVTGINPTTGQVTKSNRKFVTGTKQADGKDAVAVFTCPSPSGSCTLQVQQPLASIAYGHRAKDIEINLAGSSFFATQNGKLFRFDPGASFNKAILLADLPDALDVTISGHGVALPPTLRKDTAVFGGAGTKTLNCGNSLVAITVATAATAEITCEMDLPGEPPCLPAQGINCQFINEATDALCTQYDWNGGFCTQMTIDNPLPPSTEFSVAYIKKDEPLNAQPLIVHDFTDVTITNYFLAGVLAPEDQTRGGRGFSTNVLADRPIDDPATFVGFKGKLSTNRNSPTLVSNQIPVRPQFDHSPQAGETLQLSANCSNPFVPIPVMSVGNANDENFFRPAGNHWQFNLDLSNFPRNKLCVLSIWGNVGQFVEAFIKRK